MKRIYVLLILTSMLLTLSLSLASCTQPPAYTPKGEFYAKTSPAKGDAGMSFVISLEADRATYEGEGDITIPMEVGLGHRPGHPGYSEEGASFYVQYRVVEFPLKDGQAPAWEKTVEYEDEWADEKFDSTVPHDRSFLIIPLYGDFYPLYKETVEMVFPADVEKGSLQVDVYSVIPGHEHHQVEARFTIDFERVDGVLTLEP